MPLAETFALLVFAAVVWFWIDSLRAREAGIAEARRVCAAEGVQLLDDTVVCRTLRPARDEDGVLRLRRTYVFEYSDTGDNRRAGRIVMLGQAVEVVSLGSLWLVGNTTKQQE